MLLARIVSACFVLLAFSAKPAFAQDSPSKIANSIGMEFVLVPAGSSQMGSPPAEEGRYEDAEFLHEVQISQPYLLGVYEVTQRQFFEVMGYNPSKYSLEGNRAQNVKEIETDRFPVEWVSHAECLEFCLRLSGHAPELKAGRVYRLPTEAEWERACRAGSTTVFSFGDSLTSHLANIKGDRPYGTDETGPYLRRPSDVGSYEPNAFGLYDMHGNVSEWCLDRFAKSYYLNSQLVDPTGPASIPEGSTEDSHVVRGGGWPYNGNSARSAARKPRPAPGQKPIDQRVHYRSDAIGFRVVCLTAQPAEELLVRSEPESVSDDVPVSPESTIDSDVEFANVLNTEMRVWKAAKGESTMQARLMHYAKGEARLQDENGEIRTAKASKLCREDRKYLKSITETAHRTIEFKLQQHGLHFDEKHLFFIEETYLAQSLDQIAQCEEKIAANQKLLNNRRAERRGLDQKRAQHLKELVEAEARIQGIANGNVPALNRAVSKANQIQAKLELVVQRCEALDEEIRTTQGDSLKLAENQSGLVPKIRSLTSDIERKYTVESGDKEVQSSVRQLSWLHNTKYGLQRPELLSRAKSIAKTLKESLLSGNIPLHRVGNNFELVVKINGQPTEMLLDTGASLISLPHALARDLGIRTPEDATEIRMQIADGSIITAKLITVRTVSVGQFQVHDVQCAVLGEEARSATPLLGMSFLNNFNHELDTNNARLKLIQVNPHVVDKSR